MSGGEAITEALSWPRHVLGFEEWDAIPEQEFFRLELAEGVLVLSPQPSIWHQMAVGTMTNALGVSLPAALIPLHRVEVVLEKGPWTIRVPDVMVTSTMLYEHNPPRFEATDVHLVVEILSEGTRRLDRVLKFSEYADAGIAQYWIVDLDAPRSLAAYSLVDDGYELVAESTGLVDLEVAGYPVRVDLDALTRR